MMRPSVLRAGAYVRHMDRCSPLIGAVTAALLGCGGTAMGVVRTHPPARDDSPLAWTDQAAPIAYRMQVQVRHHLGEHELEESARGMIFVERDAIGRLRVDAEEGTDQIRLLPVDDVDAVRVLFPLPETASAVVRHREWRPVRVDGPRDRLRAIERGRIRRLTARTAEVVLERCTTLDVGTAAEPDVVRTCEHVEGTFDRRAGRPATWRIDFRIEPIRSQIEGSVEGTIDLVYDARASSARREALAEWRAAEAAGARELADYARNHGREQELAAIARRIAAREPVDQAEFTALELFHARASNTALWSLLVRSRSTSEQEHLIQVLLLIPHWFGDTVSDEAVGILREHLAEDRTLQLLAASVSDRRLEAETRQLAQSPDEDVRRAASVALARIADQSMSIEDVRAVRDDPEERLARAWAYFEGSRDPHPLVPVLLETLDRHGDDEWVRVEVARLLTSLTARDLGGDPEPWRRFWEKRQHETREAWLVSAGRDPDPEARARACEGLGYLEPSDAGRAVLYAGLRDPDLQLRLRAGEALARWRDRRAAPVLVALLGNRLHLVRARAFVALAFLAPATLGYDPGAPPLTRARAVGRWRAWLREPGPVGNVIQR
jgi:HEAT repeat protein